MKLITAAARCFPAALLLLSWGGGLQAGESARNLRQFATDRPDVTESPATVEKGRFQLESSFFHFSRDDFEGIRTETLSIGESNIRRGLTERLEVQLAVAPYIRKTVRSAEGRTAAADFGDLVVRLKYNLWGNDGGTTAFGLMPSVKIPTGTAVGNGRWEGGAIAPFSWQAGEKWSLGGQFQVDRVFDEHAGDMDWQVSHTAVFGWEVAERYGIYLEYLGVAGNSYQPFFSGGMTWELADEIQLDSGVLAGLNDAAEDIAFFAGISWRF